MTDTTQNEWEARQEARRQRFEALARKAESEGQALHRRAQGMADMIPLGQPILVDHYSAKRHRKHLEKMHKVTDRAFAAQDKARYYEDKAAGVGHGGISSDDPAAVDKLRAELAAVEKAQETMKAANQVIRKHTTFDARLDALLALGIGAKQAEEILKPDFMGYVGFPAYALSNNNANAKRIRDRIALLERRAKRESTEEAYTGFIFRRDTEENRLMFIFEGKPEEAARSALKKGGFKWSPTRGAWVRMWNGSAEYAAVGILAYLTSND